MLRIIAFLSILSTILAFHALNGIAKSRIQKAQPIRMSGVADLLTGLREPLQHQLDLVVPTMQSWNLPPPVIQWGHGLAMGSVIILVLGTGTYLGLQIKKGNGNNKYWFTLGKTAREQHPTAMLLAFVNFFIGSTGGLSSLAAQGKPILESPHAVTSIAAMGLMVIQTLTPLAIPSGGKVARKVHSALGIALVTLLLLNAYFGFSLGLSLNQS